MIFFLWFFDLSSSQLCVNEKRNWGKSEIKKKAELAWSSKSYLKGGSVHYIWFLQFYRNFRRIILASVFVWGPNFESRKVVNKFFSTKIYLLLEVHFERYKMSMVDFNTKMSIGSWKSYIVSVPGPLFFQVLDLINVQSRTTFFFRLYSLWCCISCGFF